MQKREKMMDDVARLAGGTIGVVSGLGHNLREEIKSRITEMIDHLDLVPRTDLERLETIIQETRAQNDDLKLRIETLEKKHSAKAAKK